MSNHFSVSKNELGARPVVMRAVAMKPLQRCGGGRTGTKATAGAGLPHVNWFYIIKCPPLLLASTRISSACTLVCTHPALAAPPPPLSRPPRVHMTSAQGSRSPSSAASRIAARIWRASKQPTAQTSQSSAMGEQCRLSPRACSVLDATSLFVSWRAFVLIAAVLQSR